MLTVSVIELPSTWGKPQEQLQRVDTLLTGHGADLVVLPETALTGYVAKNKQNYDLTPFAEPIDGPTGAACAELARKHRTHLVAPLVLAEGGALFNACVCYSPKGDRLFTYRKRHPWFPETWATPGGQPLPLVKIGGLTVTIAICFDVHFLTEESAEQLDQAELLLFPSAWVDDTPEAARRPLMQRVATHFGVYVANANWGRGEVKVRGQGGSCILGPAGGVLAEVNASGVATANLD